MGFFTWTLANRTPTRLKNGDYAAKCKLGYYCYGAIVCPDNSLIKEDYYEGYGMFDGRDVYDLVVDWNKDHLTDIPSLPGFIPWGDDKTRKNYMAIMKAYQEDDQEALKNAIDEATKGDPFMRTEWKRTIGIYIACENNAIIPYPIKIVDCRRPKPYAELCPSISTQ